MANSLINDIFTSFQDYMNAEQEVREEIRNIIKEIEKYSREVVTIMQIIHHDVEGSEIMKACLKAREIFKTISEYYEKLAKVVPVGQYYRYNDHWRYVTQRLCFLIALVIFLEAGFLVSKATTAEILGIKNKPEEGFHLDLEDYLLGILQLSSELVRFAVNSVTSGDYNRPLEISRFVAEVNAGFRLLNLKNDSLRKRFDALKYDVKKIEEVVYDLSIRGLRPGQSVSESAQ